MLFEFENYTDLRDCMHCNTEEKATAFIKFLHNSNRRWYSGSPYDETHTNWCSYKEDTVYYFNQGTFGNIATAFADNYAGKLLEFDDFEFEERKEFKMEIKNEKINIDDVKDILNKAILNADEVEINKLQKMIEVKNGDLNYYERKIGDYESDKRNREDSIARYADDITTQKIFQILDNIRNEKIEEGYMLSDLNKSDSNYFMNLSHTLNDYVNNVVNIESLKSSIKDVKALIESYKKDIKALKDKQKKDNTTDIQHIVKECEAISSNKLIAKIKITQDCVLIYTNELYAVFSYYGEQYKARVGKYEISVPYTQNQSGITIFNMNDDDKRSSYWSSKDNHPHVSESGHACFGNCSALIAQGYQNNSLYEIVVAVLLFLQQADTSDPAGRSVVNWDCYKMDDTPVELDEICKRCECCGEILDEDDYYVCDDCGVLLCNDCVRYLEAIDRNVCDNCFNNNYSRCEHCDEYVRNEDLRNVEDEYLCDYCCDDFIERGSIIICECCGDYIYTAHAIKTIDGYYCSDCFNSFDEEEKTRLLNNEEEENNV